MKILAEKRKAKEKKAKALRREGFLPAVVYGKKIPSTPITLSTKTFEETYKKVGESTLLDLKIKGKEPLKVLISEVQKDPVSNKILHVDFHAVELKEKITATVPLEIVGEAPIVKSGEGILLTLIDEVEVECLPTDLPKEIKVDVFNLSQIGEGISIKDLAVDPKKIKVLHDPEDLVLKIDYAEMEEEEAVPEEEKVAEVEVTEEKKETAEETAEKEKEEKEKKKGKEKEKEK